jgi:hypothetical protein
MTNMMIIFHFMIIVFKKPILKVELDFFKNASTCTKCSILSNGLQVDKILIFKKSS